MTYANTLFEDRTLVAEYAYDSQIGTNIAAGMGRRLDERLYVSSAIARFTPINGPSQSEALIRGALRTSTQPLALVFDAAITDGVPDPDNPWEFVPELDLFPKSPIAIRNGVMSDFHNLKELKFSTEVQIRY